MLFDQPADHLEPNKSLQRAEILKESAYEFKPPYLVNIFCWHAFCAWLYLHLTFAGRVLAHCLERRLNTDLIRSILE